MKNLPIRRCNLVYIKNGEIKAFARVLQAHFSHVGKAYEYTVKLVRSGETIRVEHCHIDLVSNAGQFSS